MFPDALRSEAEALLRLYQQHKQRLVTAESCTGGLLAALLTEIPGASDVVERGFITYSNQAKHALLGVEETTLLSYGAVSKETALAMAKGALKNAEASISIAITGIAGPAGATATKPVGLVHLASASTSGTFLHEVHIFPGNRSAIRLHAVEAAISILKTMLLR